MAQAILVRFLSSRGVPAEVRSAGLLAGGAPLPSDSADALGAIGLPGALPGFESAQVTRDAVTGADLVLGMTREHVRELVVRLPEAWDHTFTLKELVRRGERSGARRAGEEPAPWLARVSAGRTRAELLGASPDDDIEDPIGGSAADFARTASEIRGLCGRLVGLLWP